ncbi:uncharacterized protein [Palaemon carinicauda]|uniref:uncharacterized protein n=1 Tax=Palaemon carinicauda TaxID=392227 RepID=UPI0035B653BC
MHLNTLGFADEQRTNFTSQVHNYTLELRFKNDLYKLKPFSLCIANEPLNITFHAHRIVNDVRDSPQMTQELNDHPKEVVKAINHYLRHFANDITTTLNDLLCNDTPLTTTIPNTTP